MRQTDRSSPLQQSRRSTSATCPELTHATETLRCPALDGREQCGVHRHAGEDRVALESALACVVLCGTAELPGYIRGIDAAGRKVRGDVTNDTAQRRLCFAAVRERPIEVSIEPTAQLPWELELLHGCRDVAIGHDCPPRQEICWGQRVMHFADHRYAAGCLAHQSLGSRRVRLFQQFTLLLT